MGFRDTMPTPEQITELQGLACVIPGCSERWTDRAHIEPSGMGGRKSTHQLENIVGLCSYHHAVYDGQQLRGRQELLRVLLKEVVANQRTGMLH